MRVIEAMHEVPLEDARWEWDGAPPAFGHHLGRPCIRFEAPIATVAGLELEDGVIEVDLAVTAERGFYGVVWRLLDRESYESFFVRPHQMGNPDAVQYTPVFNDVSAWQLYHGSGFWAPVRFPLGDWFTIRVAFQGSRAEVFVGGTEEPSLVVTALKRPLAPGRVGIMAGGPPLHVARFAYADAVVLAPAAPAVPPRAGIVRSWQISDPFPEELLGGDTSLPPGLVSARSWTEIDAEPSGLVDLARVNGIRDGNDTVLARALLHAEQAEVRPLELGFSDRAIVFLHGRALFRGDDTYRSRDYRFLGSIGFHDTLFLPLEEGDNELVVAVSESFGGWGVQARVADSSPLPDVASRQPGENGDASAGGDAT